MIQRRKLSILGIAFSHLRESDDQQIIIAPFFDTQSELNVVGAAFRALVVFRVDERAFRIA
jgi:hypothetical protein